MKGGRDVVEVPRAWSHMPWSVEVEEDSLKHHTYLEEDQHMPMLDEQTRYQEYLIQD